MSGIEIVGLVLGIFPMLVDTSIDIRDVFRDVKTWWFFETEFQGFISTVQTEFIKYSMSLNILLGNLNISEDAKVKLQHDPDCKLWNAPQIQAEIKRRIHQEYWHWFLNHMNDIKGSLAELRKLLPSGEVYHMNLPGLQRQMLRLKFSFSHRKDKLVGEIRDRNGDIFNFLVQDSLLNRATISSQLKPSRNQASQFLNLKEDAVSLYETLQEHLRCECTSKHPCGVTTSDIDNEQPHDFHIKMLFHDSNVRTQLRIVTVPTIMNQAAPRSEPAIENQADNFRQDDPTKCRMRSLRNKTPKALYTLALSSVPSFGSFPHPSLAETDWAIQNEAKLKKLSHPHWFCRKKHQRAPTPPAVTRRTNNNQSSDDNKGNTHATAIKNLCSAIQPNLHHEVASAPDLGYLETRSRGSLLFTLDPQDQQPLQLYQILSLDEFVQMTPRRDARLRVGCTLVLAILNLGATSWVPECWTTRDLFLVQDRTSAAPRPYFRHDSLRNTLAEPQPRPIHMQTPRTLFSLGVLLMELIFGDKMENQPFRSVLMGADGKPNEYTDLVSALKWQQQVELELGHKLGNAVKCCLVCIFDGIQVPDLSSTTFVQAVSQQVVSPIEQFLSAWNSV